MFKNYTRYKIRGTSYDLRGMSYLILCTLYLVLSSCNNKSGSFSANTDTLSYKVNVEFLGDTNETYARITYPYFLDEDENTGINSFLLNNFTKGTKSSSFKDLCAYFIKQHDSVDVDTFESTRNWVSEKNIKVKFQYYPFISLGTTWYEFTGGAHGNHGTVFINYNCETQSNITLSDLFDAKQQIELTKIAEQIFRKNEGLKETDDYSNYFFDNGKFVLPDNFSIRKDGLLFQYGIYEIKPYVDGTTDLFVPFDDIKNLIGDQSILSALNKIENGK